MYKPLLAQCINHLLCMYCLYGCIMYLWVVCTHTYPTSFRNQNFQLLGEWCCDVCIVKFSSMLNYYMVFWLPCRPSHVVIFIVTSMHNHEVMCADNHGTSIWQCTHDVSRLNASDLEVGSMSMMRVFNTFAMMIETSSSIIQFTFCTSLVLVKILREPVKHGTQNTE